MKKYCLIFILFASCKTYRRTELVDSWIDHWNIKYKVVKTFVYDKQTDTLRSTRIDTLIFNDEATWNNTTLFK